MGRGLEPGGANGSPLRRLLASGLGPSSVPPCHCSLPSFPSSLPSPSQPHDLSAQLSQRLSQPLSPTAKAQSTSSLRARLWSHRGSSLASTSEGCPQDRDPLRSRGDSPRHSARSCFPGTVARGRTGAGESASRPRSRPLLSSCLQPTLQPQPLATGTWNPRPPSSTQPAQAIASSGIMPMYLLRAHQVGHTHRPQGSCPPGERHTQCRGRAPAAHGSPCARRAVCPEQLCPTAPSRPPCGSASVLFLSVQPSSHEPPEAMET